MSALWQQVLQIAVEHYISYSPTSAKDYAHDRGISEEVYKLLSLGGGSATHPLEEVLPSSEHTEGAKKLGLLWEDGSDAMTNRLTFPLYDEAGKVVGITGRSIWGSKIRYYTTRRTESGSGAKTILYGLHLAKPYIQKKGKVTLVEGPIDLAVAKSFPLHTAVATLGISLTDRQRSLVARYTTKVDVLFDTPEEEEKRQQMSVKIRELSETLKEYGVKTRCVTLPSGQDPADYFREKIRER